MVEIFSKILFISTRLVAMRIPSDMMTGSVHVVADGELVVIEYKGCFEVVCKFIKTGYVAVFRSDSIRTGSAKDRMKPSVLGVGFIGDGVHKSLNQNRSRTKNYQRWYHMLERCYCDKYQKRFPSYIGCSVCDEFLNFQLFASWCDDNDDELCDYELDKDGIVIGNKIYSPSMCQLIPKQENVEITHAKTFRLISPEGEEVTIFNLSKFCREKGFATNSFHSAVVKRHRSHMGWTLNAN